VRARTLDPCSDVPIEWMTFAAFDLRYGKIARIRLFADRADALESVGLSE
jgi:hypothetical protein